jgi:hypothetical protein
MAEVGQRLGLQQRVAVLLQSARGLGSVGPVEGQWGGQKGEHGRIVPAAL